MPREIGTEPEKGEMRERDETRSTGDRDLVELLCRALWTTDAARDRLNGWKISATLSGISGNTHYLVARRECQRGRIYRERADRQRGTATW